MTFLIFHKEGGDGLHYVARHVGIREDQCHTHSYFKVLLCPSFTFNNGHQPKRTEIEQAMCKRDRRGGGAMEGGGKEQFGALFVGTNLAGSVMKREM